MTRDKASATPADDEDNGHETIARLADEVLPLLIARLGESGLGELEVRQDGWRVRLRRSANGVHPENGGQPSQTAPGTASRGASAGSRPAERSPDSAGQADQAQAGQGRRERRRLAITSPAVGYYQPRDGLVVGMTVRGGDLLGHVDVLGVRQDVVAPESGLLAALAAEPGEAVEYGQPLARLEPAGEGRG